MSMQQPGQCWHQTPPIYNRSQQLEEHNPPVEGSEGSKDESFPVSFQRWYISEISFDA
jgi:hypothetical protein